MLLKEMFARGRSFFFRTLDRLDRLAQTAFSTLVTERRWFLVLSVSIYDFRRKKMRYFTSFFTYNGFLAALAPLVGFASVMGYLLAHFPSMKDHLCTTFGTVLAEGPASAGREDGGASSGGNECVSARRGRSGDGCP